MKLDGFIPENNSICCSIDKCSKTSIGHICPDHFIWMPLEILPPKINNISILRPITLCQDHFSYLEEILKDVENTYKLCQIIREERNINDNKFFTYYT